LEKGEGLLGLPRIFFYSGAKSVLSTLWPINDRSTSIFMKDFYHHLSLGYGKSRALQLAKIKMIKSKYAHPYYWAGFVLTGDCDSNIRFQ
jgi:CHAT domain-containing protein